MYHDSKGEDDHEDDELGPARLQAEVIAKRVAATIFADAAVELRVNHLARGGYNHVWLLTRAETTPTDSKPAKLVLRIQRGVPSLQPYQVRNHIACLQWPVANVPGIPVPKLYDWDDGTSGAGAAFTAEQFIEGQRLSVAWPDLTDAQRIAICGQIANVIADLGETRFNSIGSLTPKKDCIATIGPTVEAAKVFNGRTKFHSLKCYDIGPYTNSKDYILACYDREIYFYTHADQADIEDFFEGDTSVSDFIDDLKRRRQDLIGPKRQNTFWKIDAEPLVLVHEDFHAGYMLVHDGKLVAALDWEFSGVYPLSQLLGQAQLLQISMPLDDRTEETEKEEDDWHEHYRRAVRKVVAERCWAGKDIETLFSGGDEVLNVARMIMFPSPD